MKEKFMLGANYWASHAGVDMWRDWKPEVVEKDLQLLASHGITALRVFPNWRDFQPVEPVFGGGHALREYRLYGNDRPENPYYLDEVMLDRFAQFCKIAERNGMKLIVGLITGWMSGRLFIPAVLYDKNIYTDPTAQFFQQLFIKGFVERMKEEKSIYAWDLGNECNCMQGAESREAAYSWSAMIVNAIKACDQTRPIVSGMHGLELEGIWNIQDQAAVTDILTTHPYPFWVEHCQITPLNDFRTLMHATAQTQYYATVGKKPCLVEELGSMGPMNCSEEIAADFLKVNLWSNWANGTPGVFWWCAHEQSLLTATPYDWNMCERELGMTDVNLQPKPVLKQMKTFSEEMAALNLELPPRESDAVCILSQEQDHWGVAYMSYLLAKQAGLTIDFAYCEQELPESRLYFLPSAHVSVMTKRSYDALKKKVYDGSTLYISTRDGIFTEFEEFTGFKVETGCKAGKTGTISWNNLELAYKKPHQFKLQAQRAEVFAVDEEGNPMFGAASYGKGKVYFLNFPMEEMLLTEEKGFSEEYYRFYEAAAEEVLKSRCLSKSNPYVGMTLHDGEEEKIAVFVNYSGEVQDAGISFGEAVENVRPIYGDVKQMEPYSAAIIAIK